MGTLFQDLRYALRSLRRSPGFTFAAALTLALGIGANSALFSVLDALLFRPPAGVAAPARLRRVTLLRPGTGPSQLGGATASYPAYRDLRDGARAFSALAAYAQWRASYGQGAEARQLQAVLATANYFSTLGVRPQLGRFFPAVGDRAMPALAVLGYDFWRREFGGDPTVIGRMVRFGTFRAQVVGVAPDGFRGVDLAQPDVYLPVRCAGALVPTLRNGGSAGLLEERNSHFLRIVGRLAPGAGQGAAAAEATSVLRAAEETEGARWRAARQMAPASTAWRVALAPIQDHFGTGQGGHNPVPLWLLGVTAIFLLLACVNVANLLLARGLRRRRELAIRLALGAGRGRLIRQQLIESAILAMLAVAPAVMLATWTGGLVKLLPLPTLPELFSARVLVFTLAIATATILAAGLFPALRSTRLDIEGELKGASFRATAGGTRLRQGIMAAQLALSLLLLVGAGLFFRSLLNVRAIDLGYDADHVLTVVPSLQEAGYSRAAAAAFQDAAVRRLSTLPGVRSAALGQAVPARALMSEGPIVVEGPSGTERDEEMLKSAVTPGYFRAMGARLRAGRDFAPGDQQGRVAIVNQEMARRFWPGESAVGRCFRVGDDAPCQRVVGVVGDMKMKDIGEVAQPMFFQPLPQDPPELRASGTIHVRVSGNVASAEAAIRRALVALDPRLPYVDVHPLGDNFSAQFAPWRMAALVTGVFAALALLLAVVGLYGVIAFLTEQRTREIGVRTALGADRRRITRLVLGEGARVAAVGCVVGGVLALALARLVRARLYGVDPADPLTYAAVVLLLCAAVLLASYLPARRAARVQPTQALKYE